jgi:hypothetical protein
MVNKGKPHRSFVYTLYKHFITREFDSIVFCFMTTWFPKKVSNFTKKSSVFFCIPFCSNFSRVWHKTNAAYIKTTQ